ncbi:MAG: hypothetical protein Q4Q07_08845 [Tissierellia bacterium]|nr:hypothetical protein [Tissierellia bacterium]
MENYNEDRYYMKINLLREEMKKEAGRKTMELEIPLELKIREIYIHQAKNEEGEGYKKRKIEEYFRKEEEIYNFVVGRTSIMECLGIKDYERKKEYEKRVKKEIEEEQKEERYSDRFVKRLTETLIDIPYGEREEIRYKDVRVVVGKQSTPGRRMEEEFREEVREEGSKIYYITFKSKYGYEYKTGIYEWEEREKRKIGLIGGVGVGMGIFLLLIKRYFM